MFEDLRRVYVTNSDFDARVVAGRLESEGIAVLVQQLGAGRASMVTYVVPAVGLLLGVLVLSDPLDWQIILGGALVFSGIAVVNISINALRRMASRAGAVEKLAVESSGD